MTWRKRGEKEMGQVVMFKRGNGKGRLRMANWMAGSRWADSDSEQERQERRKQTQAYHNSVCLVELLKEGQGKHLKELCRKNLGKFHCSSNQNHILKNPGGSKAEQ